MSPPTALTHPKPPDGPTSGGLEPTRSMDVLVVEDHAPSAQALAMILRRAGHNPIVASRVAEALQIAAASRFDVLISDICLPDGFGYEIMRLLRSREGIRGLAVSALSQPEDIERSFAAGFSNHLTKPVRSRDVLAFVEAVAPCGHRS